MRPEARSIASLQRHLVATWHASTPTASGEGLLRLVAENHLRNFLLWHEEDIARRDDLGSDKVRDAKRAIDRYNQQRNDFMEQMDDSFVELLAPRDSGCPCHSETPGMIVDRLSIFALKEYHMREESLRSDAAGSHRNACEKKLAQIERQHANLVACLVELIDDIIAGRRTFRLFRQFKMYNDPALNPQLYGRESSVIGSP